MKMSLGHYLYHWEANYGLGQMQIYFEEETTSSEKSPPVDAHFLDGAAVVQMLNPRTANTTFLDYQCMCFAIYVPERLHSR